MSDTNGSGTCVDHNMNMPEGAKITFQACLVDHNGRRSNCSGQSPRPADRLTGLMREQRGPR